MLCDALPADLKVWSNFYVIMGSAAAALTALMFVAITLVAARPNTSRDAISTFSTPTVMLFCGVLLTSAIMTVPWSSLAHAAVFLGGVGIYGTGYAVHVAYRLTRLSNYAPEKDDWLWHAALPIAAYLALAAGALVLALAPVQALFVLATAVVSLVFIGIHNAWDVVTYVAIEDP